MASHLAELVSLTVTINFPDFTTASVNAYPVTSVNTHHVTSVNAYPVTGLIPIIMAHFSGLEYIKHA